MCLALNDFLLSGFDFLILIVLSPKFTLIVLPVLGFVADTPNAIATLIQEYPNVEAIEFKMPFSFERKTYKKIKKGDAAWKKLMDRYIDNSTKAILKKDFQLK